jgi:hypothetical protein
MTLAVLIFGPRNLLVPVARIGERFDRLFARFMPADVTIVHGAARGIDSCGDDFARIRGYECERFPYPPDSGRAGGPRRNLAMAQRLIEHRELGAEVFGMGWRHAHWTPGTANMADTLERHGIACRIEVCR